MLSILNSSLITLNRKSEIFHFTIYLQVFFPHTFVVSCFSLVVLIVKSMISQFNFI